MLTHSPRAFPWEKAPPVGTCQVTGKHRLPARGRRPRQRTCLRKGCRRKYRPRCSYQHYCQEPECLREVRRWQAARRQAKRRQDARVKARHAQAEKERRQRAKLASQAVEDPEVVPERGHAAEIFFHPHSAIGQAATNRPWAHSATRHTTALPPAVKLFTTFETVNASGSLAALWRVVRNGPSGTLPLASAACFSKATPLTRYRYGHLVSENSSRARRS